MAAIRIGLPAFGLLLALLSSVTPGAAQERVALVIGNGNYVNAGVLTNPANDARAVAESLRAIGFDVTEGVDLGRGQMEDQIRAFLNKATSAKVALLYYAGHGMQIDGRNYLVPVDAKLQTLNDVTFGTVELDRVLSGLNDPSRASIVVLDACRDNPMARVFASNTRSAAVGTGLAAYATVGTGTLIAYSTAPGKVAADGNRGNSPFSESFAKHLRMPGLEVRQLLTRVRNEVAAETGEAQVPWDTSSLRGDVYLAGLPGASAPADTARKIETLPAPQSPGFKPASAQPATPAAAPPPKQATAPGGQWSEDAMRESFVIAGAGSVMTGQTVVLTARDGRKMTCVGGSITQKIPRRCAWH
jgi:hypothetical protein